MGKLFVGALVVGAVILGWAVYTGNAKVDMTERGHKTVANAKEAVSEQADEAGVAAQKAMEKALEEGKRRIHDATAE